MRILLVHNYYQQPGGEDVSFAAEKEMLESHGHEIVELTDTNDRVNDYPKIKIAQNAIWSKETTLKVENLIACTEVDIAHVHNTWMMLSPSIYYALEKRNIPVVQTLHNFRLLCPNALFFRNNHVCEDCMIFPFPFPSVFHACYRDSTLQTSVLGTMLVFHRLINTWKNKINTYIALTDFSREKFIQGGLPKEKIVVKPNFVSPPSAAMKSEKKYVLFIGRLSPEKGIDILLDAWKKLSDIPLKIIGDGMYREKVSGFADTHKNVEYVGQVSRKDVSIALKEAQFLVFPSSCYETFGIVVIEAFAHGTPVLASRLGSMAEIISEHDTGMFFESGSRDDLASKVLWLWNHPEVNSRMGENARREYENKYTPEKNYQQLMDIYDRVLNTSN